MRHGEHRAFTHPPPRSCSSAWAPPPQGSLPAARHRPRRDEVVCLDTVGPRELRDLYAASDVLVLPSIPTRAFREPWGLVVNEAMNRGLPVIATDAVGAAAGGLVRDGHNGLVVGAGDRAALADALGRLAGDIRLRSGWGRPARKMCARTATTPGRGASPRALATLGLSLGRW